MTNRKNGPASYDNDQQRQVGGASGEPEAAMYEKGTQMERGTAHEFSSEPVSDVGAKGGKVSDSPPGSPPAGK